MDGRAIEPALPVDGLLLDLARMLDQWNVVSEVVPSVHEVFEGTGIGVDLSEEDVDQTLVDRVVQMTDGHHSLHQIATIGHTTPYAVMNIAAALFQGGAIRAVPTPELITRAEDFLSRGEAAGAVPLLRRSIERGDAPPEARLLLADALEASGIPEAAAAELDTFAALSDEDDAPAVFEALARALTLRGGDRATAMRVCDFYLRRRPWLQDYQSQAKHALRDLIHAATTSRRPLDAAYRLAGFIKAGDAPSEDLLLLADLFAAGGEQTEAAAALLRRADMLIAAERRPLARDLLRRALQHDPGQADVRRRLTDLEGDRRRRLHKTRMSLLVLLTLVVAGGAGTAWWFYRQSAVREVGGAHTGAEQAVEDAERKARELIAAFKARVAEAETRADEDAGLEAAADALRSDVREAMGAAAPQLVAYGAEIETYAASGNQERHRLKLRSLEQRRAYMNSQATAVVADLAERARQALEAGRRLNVEGKLLQARAELRKARNLAIRDPDTQARATQFLVHVDRYFESFEKYRRQMVAATERGDLAGAFDVGVTALRELEDSDLTMSLPFPVHASSEPAGAEVWLGTRNTGLRTPCVVTYSPFESAPELILRLPGRTHASTPLPSFAQICARSEALDSWVPRFEATLRPGPRWKRADPGGGFTALWAVGDAAVVAGNRGRAIHVVDPWSGVLHAGPRLEPAADPVREGGVLQGGVQWQVRGLRTLVIEAPGRRPWQVHALDFLAWAPAVTDGVVILADQSGSLYGLDAGSGERIWRGTLGAPPSQAPFVSPRGVAIATVSGAAYWIDPQSGKLRPIAPSVRGPALVAPLGDGTLVIGGGAGGLRWIDAQGRIEVLGDAAPLGDRRAWSEPDGVAWHEAGGVRWIDAATRKPIDVRGLGTKTLTLAGGGRCLLACTSDGTLVCVDRSKPDERAWEAPLGSRPLSPPVVLGRAAFVRVEGALAAVEIRDPGLHSDLPNSR
jgi:outer membrane protein assembly factor BamB